MQKRIGTNLGYFLLLIPFCAVIPHTVLCFLQLHAVSAVFSPFELEGYSNFFVCQWISFWLTLLSYLRLQKADRFSWMPSVCSGIIVLSYLPRFEQASILTIARAIPLALAMELTGFLKKAECSSSKIVCAIGSDRNILRAFYYWSVVFPCVALISCKACTFERTVASPFLMLPIPGILLFGVFRHQKMKPPALWTVLGMLAAIPLSFFLVSVGPMAQFRMYHFMCLAVGYILLFLMLVVYNMDHWKK